MKIDGMDAKMVNIGSKNDSPALDDTVKVKKTEVPAKVSQTDVKVMPIHDGEKKEFTVAEKTVIEAIEKANKAIIGSNRKFEFSIHEKTKEIMVKVVDTDTNKIIKEIPNEKILDMVAKMWEMSGIMVDKKG